MKNLDFSTIYNTPEEISGIGWLSHLIGFSLYIVLFVLFLPAMSVDPNCVKDSVELIIAAGIWVTLGMAFVFIVCPIYFFVRFVMELFRTIKSKYKFYSTPNIEYIKLNDDDLFFKNTCNDYSFSSINLRWSMYC